MLAHSGQGWLPLLLPVDARRFRVQDPALAATLRYAGAELVDTSPQVEIAAGADVGGDAPLVLVTVEEAPPERGPRAVRAISRAAAIVRVRLRARAVRRRVAQRGYRHAEIVAWDVDRPFRPQRSLNPKRLPLRAVVVGSRSSATRTVFEAALAASGMDPARVEPVVRQGGVVALGEAQVLRVAVGPARQQIEAQRSALASIAAAQPPHAVAVRMPWPLVAGRAGLASWSLERTLPGVTPPLPLTGRLLADCGDFLVALHALGDSAPAKTLTDDVAVVTGVCSGEQARALEHLAPTLAGRLDGLPRGFGHGDFWRRNLLVEHGRLSGVVDWASAEPGRLPLLDLLHLYADAARERRRGHLGPAIVGDLLPWARAGGDEVARLYAERVGFTLDRSTLEALVLAYWLDFIAGQLRLFVDRADSKVWIRQNVELVLNVVSTRL